MNMEGGTNQSVSQRNKQHGSWLVKDQQEIQLAHFS